MKSVTEERLSTADFVLTGKEAEERDQTARAAGKEAEERDQTARAAPPPLHDETHGPLLPADAVNDLRNRWGNIQAGFVDEPQAAVQQADELVAMTMKRLAEGFAEQRNNLERQWARGGDVSTEDLRQALRKYRSFFERLLTIQAPVA
jgi:hypothetical protein